MIRMADHRISLKDEEKTLHLELESFYRQTGLASPTLKEVLEKFSRYPQPLIKEVMALMTDNGQLVKVNEDLYFYGPPLAELQEKLLAHLVKESEIDMPAFKDMTGLSRKYSVPLLEYFDKIKITIRVGDKRILREQQK